MSTTYVSSGQTRQGGIVAGSDSQIFVEAGGTIVGVQVVNSAYADIASGAAAYGTILRNGGDQDVDLGGYASGTTILSGGDEDVFGRSDSAVISAGGEQYTDLYGAVTYGVTVLSGGVQYVGGVESSDETVGPLGSADATVLQAGEQDIERGGVAVDTIVEQFGVQDVGLAFADIAETSDFASGTTVGAGGSVIVAQLTSGTETFTGSGQTAVVQVTEGGAKTVITYTGGAFDGGVFTFTQDEDVVKVHVSFDGQSENFTSSGYINLAGVLEDATIQSGGTLILDGGQLSNVAVLSGATEQIGGAVSLDEGFVQLAGVVESGNVVSEGVSAVVFSGAVDFGATINSGGKEFLSSGGVAKAMNILSGGLLRGDGGVLAGTLTDYGVIEVAGSGLQVSGVLIVESGGVDSGTLIVSGGQEDVLSGGRAAADVQAGGKVVVDAGG